MKRWRYILLTLGLLICLAPLGGVLWSTWFAKRHGCNLNEAQVHPCIVDGIDWGDTLSGAFVGGWFMLVTLPIAALLGLGLLVMIVVDLRRRWRG